MPTYFLKPDTGSDSNSGSQSFPWKTLVKVKTTVVAGDTVNVIGGTYTQAQVAGESSGTAYRWHQGHSLGIAGSPITIQANPGDTVIFDGQGDVNWQTPYTNNAYNGHYLIVQNMTFQNYTCQVIPPTGDTGATLVKFVTVRNCTLKNIIQQQSAPLAAIFAEHLIFTGNTIFNVGGPNQSSIGDNNPHNQHGIYLADQCRYCVIANNTVEHISGWGLHFYNVHGPVNTVQNIIVHHNTITNCHQAGTIITGYTFNKFSIFNNTYYSEPIPFGEIDSAEQDGVITFHLGGLYSNIIIKNNIGYGYFGIDTFVQENTSQFTNLINDYNFWSNLADSNRVMKWDSTEYSLASFKSSIGRELASLTGTPLFTNASSRNFTLQNGSTAINAGQVLTTVTSSSGSGTTLVLNDANYFHDGYGMITGDSIKIGSNAPVTITSVDYTTNIITVNTSVTWTTGDAVGFAWNGSAPDMGAFESSFGATPDNPPIRGVMSPGLKIMMAT